MQVIKYRLNPGMNTIKVLDGYQLKLRYLNDQDGKLVGWFEETTVPETTQYYSEYEVYLALTGEHIPDDYHYCCSYQERVRGGYFVVHAYD